MKIQRSLHVYILPEYTMFTAVYYKETTKKKKKKYSTKAWMNQTIHLTTATVFSPF